MNKTDILAKKIKHGAKVKDHIPEYHGESDFIAVASCRSSGSDPSQMLYSPNLHVSRVPPYFQKIVPR